LYHYLIADPSAVHDELKPLTSCQKKVTQDLSGFKNDIEDMNTEILKEYATKTNELESLWFPRADHLSKPCLWNAQA
jgi:hypothetical protein